MMTMRRATIGLSIALFLFGVVDAEIISLSLILNADSTEVHYVRGWLDAPAHIDLSETKFMTAVVPNFDDDYDNEYDDVITSESPTNYPENSTPEPTTPSWPLETPAPSSMSAATTAMPTNAPTLSSFQVGSPAPSSPSAAVLSSPAPSSTNAAALSSPAPSSMNAAALSTPVPSSTNAAVLSSPAPSSTNAAFLSTPAPSSTNAAALSSPAPSGDRRARYLEEPNSGGPRVKQFLDIVLFFIPETCKTNSWGGCDWSALGIGRRDDRVAGGVNYCCSEDAIPHGTCTSDQIGRLIINQDLFQGVQRSIEVPTNANQEFELEDPLFDISVTGEYVLLLGNCDDYGVDVFGVGTMEWKSVKGYLPGEMYGLMFFYVALTVIYVNLVLWYYCGMRLYQDAAIPIQKFILATIVLGLLEFFFRSLDLGMWNLEGTRSVTIVWIAVILGVMKLGITRCLFVMVSMGWGVVRDTLGFALVKIIVLGAIYCALTLSRDILSVLAYNKVESWSATVEEEFLDLLLLVTLALAAVNTIFFFWILSSLAATTEYLKSMNQTTKLRRHLRLRCIVMTSFVLAVAWLVFSIVDGVVGILSTTQFWILEGLTYLNSLFVIFCVAILWRPNSNAKDYAMQMELPALGEDGEHELELSCVVPSAGEFDDRDDDTDEPSSLPVDNAVQS